MIWQTFSRPLTVAATALLAVASVHPASAQFDPMGGFRQDAYWRIGLGTSQPVASTGVYQDFNRGFAVSVSEEAWRPDANGNANDGSGFTIEYARFPLNQSFFNQTFQVNPGEHPTSSSGSGGFYMFAFQLLRRLPFPALDPSATFGLGLFDLARSTVNYQSTSGNGSTGLPERYGLMGSGGLTLDQHVTDRWGVFAQGIYTIAWDISTYRYAANSASCAGSSCVTVNEKRLAPIADLRAGIRFRTR